MPLGAVGRFCIGLPTLVQTGSPFWVSSHFHGKIDRTAIDFANDFNRLLFDAAEDLAETLLDRLKCDGNKATQRLVTLAMDATGGLWPMPSMPKTALFTRPSSWATMGCS